MKNSSDVFRHIALKTPNGFEVELHNRFSGSDNREQNRRLDDLLYRAIPSRVTETVCSYSIPVLPTAENGIVLLGHINHHLPDGLGLRQIIDWMLYVERCQPDGFWENGFAETAASIGLERLAILTTAMCQKYLGLSGDIRWAHYEPVCDELMEYILAHGNFGKKLERTEAKTVSVLRSFRNPAKALVKAQQYGLQHWEACQKHRWLRPFAWLYQLVRWVDHGRKCGVTLGLLDSASSTAKEEAEFLKRLGVTRL